MFDYNTTTEENSFELKEGTMNFFLNQIIVPKTVKKYFKDVSNFKVWEGVFIKQMSTKEEEWYS